MGLGAAHGNSGSSAGAAYLASSEGVAAVGDGAVDTSTSVVGAKDEMEMGSGGDDDMGVVVVEDEGGSEGGGADGDGDGDVGGGAGGARPRGLGTSAGDATEAARDGDSGPGDSHVDPILRRVSSNGPQVARRSA